jgi:diaminohydroxyphosphoribosylaminopyrimidine deaminase/5-amino-6-(5-phosphoribosylamino)uracil reductase
MAPRLMGSEARGMFQLGTLESMAESISLEWMDAVRIGPDLRLRFRPQYGES